MAVCYAWVVKGARYCRRCLYDLSGSVVDRPEKAAGGPCCPECGREFDPADPATTLGWRRPRWTHWITPPVLRCTGLVVVLAACFLAGWLPRPLDTGWRHWEWLGREYARETVWSGQRRVVLTVWADRRVRAAGFDESGRRVFTVEHPDDGAWRIAVEPNAARWPEVFRAMSRLDDFRSSIGFGADPERTAPAALVAEGDADDIVRAIIRGFALDPDITMERLGDGDWSLVVARPVAAPERLLDLFNKLRGQSRYGVFTPRPGPLPDTARPFTLRGTEADVFWMIVNEYGLLVDKPERVPPRSDGWHPTAYVPPAESGSTEGERRAPRPRPRLGRP